VTSSPIAWAPINAVAVKASASFNVVSLEEVINNHLALSSQVTTKLRPIEYFLKYIKYGAYPFYLESIENYPMKLLEVINVTLESDLPAIFNIDPGKLDKLKKLLYMLCTTPPVELNKMKLSSAIGTSWPTVTKHLALMSKASLRFSHLPAEPDVFGPSIKHPLFQQGQDL
jgi:uncharacterized protein